MSLLIDALKQAEATQRQANQTEPSATTASLQLESVYSQTESIPKAAPTTKPAAEIHPDIHASSREAVHELFEIKRFAAPNRLPKILITSGLILLAVGYICFWWAGKQSEGLLSHLTPTTPAKEILSTPFEPDIASTTSAQPQTDPSPAVSAVQTTELLPKRIQSTPAREAAFSEDLQPHFSGTPVLRRSSSIHPTNEAVTPLQQAFTAYTAGDLANARQSLLGILRTEPKNIDALNAIAMIALRSARPEEAEFYYRQALVIDPKDANTRAQLALLYAESDPSMAESRLRLLLAEQPESAPALFALGSIYSRQSRWNEAQHAFFQAHTLDAANADTLYNLAVSLDHLNQPKLAQQYYERAAAAGQHGQIAFNPESARKRADALQDSTARKPPTPEQLEP